MTTPCSSCKFWDRSSQDKLAGVCRRRAPGPLMVAEYRLVPVGASSYLWPVTKATDTCGESRHFLPWPLRLVWWSVLGWGIVFRGLRDTVAAVWEGIQLSILPRLW